jgi:hypothetical protein
MGSDWSCPCTDRERIKSRLPENDEQSLPKSKKEKFAVELKLCSQSKVQRMISKPGKDEILASLSRHPTKNSIMLFYQPEVDLEFAYSENKSYEFFQFNFDLPENLAFEIEQKYSDGFYFIGGFFDLRHVHLAFYRSDVGQDRKIVVKMETGFDLKELKNVFVEEEGSLYLGAIQYRDSAILVFEKSITPRPYTYFIAEFPQDELDTRNFEDYLKDRINDCVNHDKVRFRACLPYEKTLYLIFIK